MIFRRLSHETIMEMKLIWSSVQKQKLNPSILFRTIHKTMSLAPLVALCAPLAWTHTLSWTHRGASLWTSLVIFQIRTLCVILYSCLSAAVSDGLCVGGSRGKSSAGWLIELKGFRFVADWCFDKWRKRGAVVLTQQHSDWEIRLGDCLLFFFVCLLGYCCLIDQLTDRLNGWSG